jgi:RHS repeat-associated protein
LEERIVGGTTAVNQYVWDQSYIDAPLVRFHDGNNDGDLGDTGVDDKRYYTWDANHNVTTTITIDPNTTQTITHYVYDAYGKATVYNGTWSTSLGAPSEDGPLYCGYFFDKETANFIARHRIYSVALATWLSRDPIGYKGGKNLYEYVGNSPLANTDPTGEYSVYYFTIPFFCSPLPPFYEYSGHCLCSYGGNALSAALANLELLLDAELSCIPCWISGQCHGDPVFGVLTMANACMSKSVGSDIGALCSCGP